jgi:hypothetical protein
VNRKLLCQDASMSEAGPGLRGGKYWSTRVPVGRSPTGLLSSGWRLLTRIALLGASVTLILAVLFVLVIRDDPEAQRFVLSRGSLRTDAGGCPVPLRRVASCRREDRLQALSRAGRGHTCRAKMRL